MKPEEAIWRIKDHCEVHRLNEPQAIRITEALNLAISALEKQIPKEPTGDLSIVPHLRCPNCHRAVVVVLYSGDRFPFCQWCGQALDWGENNE